MFKKSLALWLAIALMLMCFAGCGTAKSDVPKAAESKGSTEEVKSTVEVLEQEEAFNSVDEDVISTMESAIEGTPEVIYPLVEETETLTMWNQTNPWMTSFFNTYDEHPGYQQAEAITNVHIEFTSASFMEADTQFQLMIASGDYRDLIDGTTQLYTGGAAGALDENVIIELNDLLDEYAPHYSALLSADPNVYKEIMLDDGTIACFSPIRDLDNYLYPGNGLLIRQDMLDAVGKEIPETYDELHDVLAAFKEQLGVQEPLYLDPSGVFQDNLLAAGFGVAIMTRSGMHQTMPFYQIDGQVHYGIIEEGFRDYITMMHQWYEEGIIGVDFASNYESRHGDYTAVVASNDTGVFLGANTAISSYIAAGQMINPDYNIVPMSDITKEKGKKTHLGYYVSHSGTGGLTVTTACENVPLAVQWCDFWYSDQGILIANWGVEGESYELDENGNPYFTEIMTNNSNFSLQEMTGKYCLYTSTVETTLTYDSARVLLEQYPEIALKAVEIWRDGKDGEYELPERMAMTSDESAKFNGYYSDMETMVAEAIPKFINGDKALDELDAFAEELISMGAEECIALKQAALDRFNER